MHLDLVDLLLLRWRRRRSCRGGRRCRSLARGLLPARLCRAFWRGVHLRPVTRRLFEAGLVGEIVLCDFGVLRVFGFWRAEKGLEGDEGGAEGEDG